MKRRYLSGAMAQGQVDLEQVERRIRERAAMAEHFFDRWQVLRTTRCKRRHSTHKSLRELLDRQAILDCIHRYCRGVDRFDREMVLSVYHPDAIDHHGVFVGGPEAFVDWAFAYHAEHQEAHHHMVTESLRVSWTAIRRTRRHTGSFPASTSRGRPAFTSAATSIVSNVATDVGRSPRACA